MTNGFSLHASVLGEFPHDRVIDLRRRGTAFEQGILDDVVLAKRVMERDVDLPIDCSGNQKARVLFVVGRQVGASAAETDSKWGAGNNHSDL